MARLNIHLLLGFVHLTSSPERGQLTQIPSFADLEILARHFRKIVSARPHPPEPGAILAAVL
jgi:hypothetical protein